METYLQRRYIGMVKVIIPAFLKLYAFTLIVVKVTGRFHVTQLIVWMPNESFRWETNLCIFQFRTSGLATLSSGECFSRFLFSVSWGAEASDD